ncbi:MAG: ATP-grasp domain-containing protein, partial [Pseudomonadota bacterium]
LRPNLSKHARGALLIAAVSGRALARAAAHAGYAPLVADFFADLDTQTLAAGAHKVPGDISRGFHWETLEPALKILCARAPSPPLGLVYGSGFEDRPQVLDRIAQHWPLLGNDSGTVADVNDPERFFSALDREAIRHPEVRLEQPEQPSGWIAKRSGGAGGSHVVPAEERQADQNIYFQRLMPGRTVSTLFVANRETAAVLGFSEQWTAPAEGKPWRHGGAAYPAELPAGVADQLVEIIQRIAVAFQLVGLNSADFLLKDTEPLLIEINPRAGGTLDLYEDAKPPLLAVHLDAVLHGVLPKQPVQLNEATASMVVFAPGPLTIPEDMDWPHWAADLPKEGERIDKERPICTVLARAGSMDQARRLVQARVVDLLSALQAAETRPYAD